MSSTMLLKRMTTISRGLVYFQTMFQNLIYHSGTSPLWFTLMLSKYLEEICKSNKATVCSWSTP